MRTEKNDTSVANNTGNVDTIEGNNNRILSPSELFLIPEKIEEFLDIAHQTIMNENKQFFDNNQQGIPIVYFRCELENQGILTHHKIFFSTKKILKKARIHIDPSILYNTKKTLRERVNSAEPGDIVFFNIVHLNMGNRISIRKYGL